MGKRKPDPAALPPFGSKAILFPAEEFNLDEDATLFVRVRPSARDSIEWAKAGESLTPYQIVERLVVGWENVKLFGQELRYRKEAVLDLPYEMLQRVIGELESSPFGGRGVSSLINSDSPTETSEPDKISPTPTTRDSSEPASGESPQP